MAKLAEAYVDITVKLDQLNKGLATSEARLQQFASKANSLLSAVGIGIGVAGAGRFLAEVAEKASDLGETMSKTAQVFGASTGQIVAMADDMADRFGAVRTVTLDAAAMFGLITQGAGLSAKASADLSVQLVRLADDASSFFNVPLDVALEKIRAGLVGESEPLRAFGVMLSESAVQAKAVELGLTPLSGHLTEQEKVMARVKLITEGLAKAQGDHERTMGSYANQVRRLSGEWQNFLATAGGPAAGAGAVMMNLIRERPGDVLKSIFSVGMWQNFNFQDVADKMAGVQAGGIQGPPNRAAVKNQMDLAVLGNAVAAMAAARGAAFEAGRFGGGGFGAFGMMGDLGQAFNVAGLDADIARRERDMRMRAWSGGWGGLSALDFSRAAQESISRPKDETAKQQLDELKKIREALTRQQPGAKGAVLRGPA